MVFSLRCVATAGVPLAVTRPRATPEPDGAKGYLEPPQNLSLQSIGSASLMMFCAFSHLA